MMESMHEGPGQTGWFLTVKFKGMLRQMSYHYAS